MKPENYPLPWCEKFDCPYWQINLYLCYADQSWGKKQSHIPMSEVIPWIDELIENGKLSRRDDGLIEDCI